MENKTISLNKKEDCSGCRACEKSCPNKAINMKEDEEGFLYPYIDEKKCNSCGKCMSICKKTTRHIKRRGGIECYAAYAEKDEVRNNSSSGAVFPLLAEEFLKNGGHVFGAAYKDIYSVFHTSVSNVNELNILSGSKYIQSDVLDCYSEVENYLENGRCVLFSGTPCQISGLKKYLKREYKDLYCVSLVCHGVPSSKVWRRYIEETIRDHEKSEPKSVCFRKKRGDDQFFELYGENWSLGWKCYETTFMRGFLKDFYLRPSCYNCKDKGVDIGADIIIGDFWGVEHFDKSLSGVNSVSACIILSEKGKALFTRTQGLKTIKCDYADIVYGNRLLEESADVDQQVRSYFFSIYKKNEYSLSKCILKTEEYIKTIRQEKGIIPSRFNKNINISEIVLWGVGKCYKDNIEKIKSIIDVDYVCDNSFVKKTNMIDDINVILPSDVGKLHNPFVIIMIENAKVGFQVAQQLLDMGVTDFDLYNNWINYFEDFACARKRIWEQK